MDIAVVHCSSNHYLPLGECIVIVVFCTVIDSVRAVTDVNSTAIVVHVVSIFTILSSTAIVADATAMH